MGRTEDHQETTVVRRWYHPVNETKIEALFSDIRIPEGTFVVHSKDQSNNDFLITVKTPTEYNQIKITCDPKRCKYVIGRQNKICFNNVAEILANILAGKLSIKVTKSTELVLKEHLPCSIPASGWFLPEKPPSEALEILKRATLAECFVVWHVVNYNYMLGIKHRSGIVTLEISRGKKGYTLDSNIYFKSVADLIMFYQSNPIPGDVDGKPFCLPFPYHYSAFYAGMIMARMEELSKPVPQIGGAASNDGFYLEFNEIERTSKQFPFSVAESQNPQWAYKNRYKNVLPYEHTRVRLANSTEDYINANFVQAAHQINPCCYILSQAPLDTTLEDHWAMIIQENIRLVVVLTNIVENGVPKCCRYWPEKDSKMKLSNGKILVLEQEEDKGDTIHRIVAIHHGSSDNTALTKVCILQYREWPDFGVPKEPWGIIGLLTCCNAIRNNGPKTTMLVHCSAGIGRTGTFVVLDMVLNQIKAGGLTTVIDIKDTVLKLRTSRPLTITTLDQYRFIYEVINKYLECKMGTDPFQF